MEPQFRFFWLHFFEIRYEFWRTWFTWTVSHGEICSDEFWVLSVTECDYFCVCGGGSTLKSDVFLKAVRRVERFMTERWSCWRVWWLNRKCQPCSTVSSWYSSTACRSAATYSNRYNVSWSTSFCCRYFLLSAEEHVCRATLCKAPYRIICYLFLSVCLFVCPSVCLSVCLCVRISLSQLWPVSKWLNTSSNFSQLFSYEWKKRSDETQTVRAGCSKAESKNFAPPQTPSRGRGAAKI